MHLVPTVPKTTTRTPSPTLTARPAGLHSFTRRVLPGLNARAVPKRSLQFIRETRPVHDHPITPVWLKFLSDAEAYLEACRVKFTVITGFGFANAGAKTAFCPLLVIIGVPPSSLAFEEAKTAADYSRMPSLAKPASPTSTSPSASGRRACRVVAPSSHPSISSSTLLKSSVILLRPPLASTWRCSRRPTMRAPSAFNSAAARKATTSSL